MFFSEPVIWHPSIPHLSAVLPLDARAHRLHQVRWKYRDRWTSTLKPNCPYNSVHRSSFFYVPYIPVFFWSFFARVTDDRHQATFRVHDAACTTLPSSSGSRQPHVRVAYPRCTAASCICQSLPFVTRSHRTSVLQLLCGPRYLT